MVSMLICFRNDTEPKPLKDFVCGDPVWKNDVEDVFILNESETTKLISVAGADRQYLSVTGRGSIKGVRHRDILYLEKAGRCIMVRKEDGTSCVFYGKFEHVMETLSEAFCRCHKSYIVNMEKAEELRRYVFRLKNGEQLPVSQKKYQDVRESYRIFLSVRILLQKRS